ncbi:MAG: lysoplasmalogenase [Actinomycetota bacterium]|nr:lysoplasmalogenase [Actinomycetota bacterium]
MSVLLFVLAGVVAVLDWMAVDQRLFRLEYLFKPATIALLIAATVTAHLGPSEPWVVAALALGLIGDVGLMLAGAGKPDVPFIAGLAAFLVGHLCYLVAFVRFGIQGVPLVAGLLVVAGIAGLSLPQVLRGAARAAGRRFAVVVGIYAGVLALMAIFAAGTQLVATAIGGLLFLTSDTLIARSRFVAPVPRGPLVIIVTYHLAQFLIVLGLVRAF